MKRETRRNMLSDRVHREIAPLKALFPTDGYFTAWGIVPTEDLLGVLSYQMMTAPYPLEYLDEVDELTGKPKIKGKVIINATTFKEFESKIKLYIDEHESDH